MYRPFGVNALVFSIYRKAGVVIQL